MFLECDISRKDNRVGSRKDNRVGSRIICLVGFLTKGVNDENGNVSSRMEL